MNTPISNPSSSPSPFSTPPHSSISTPSSQTQQSVLDTSTNTLIRALFLAAQLETGSRSSVVLGDPLSTPPRANTATLSSQTPVTNTSTNTLIRALFLAAQNMQNPETRSGSSVVSRDSFSTPPLAPRLGPRTPPSRASNITPLPMAVDPLEGSQFVTPQHYPSDSEESQPITPRNQLHPRGAASEPLPPRQQRIFRTNRTRHLVGVNAGLGLNPAAAIPLFFDEPYAGALAATEIPLDPNNTQPNIVLPYILPPSASMFATPYPSSNESTPPLRQTRPSHYYSDEFTYRRSRPLDSPPQAQSGPRILSAASAGAGTQTHTGPLNHSPQLPSHPPVHERQNNSALAGESSRALSLQRIRNSLQQVLGKSVNAKQAKEIFQNFIRDSKDNDETSSPDKTP